MNTDAALAAPTFSTTPDSSPQSGLSASPARVDVAIVGGGPAGLMAAETIAAGGRSVQVYDAMPSVGRKFLLAGKGGLNLTHAEPSSAFRGRYRERSDAVGRWLDRLDADGLRAWAVSLGVETFVGSSGRVFPAEMKAAPLLRAWLQRLRRSGVGVHTRHRWSGWRPGDPPTRLHFETPQGRQTVDANAVVLALGGASWPQLGSDGRWQPWLAAQGVDVAPLQPANCGFDVASPRAEGGVGWSALFRERQAGAPLKAVVLVLPGGTGGEAFRRRGEFVVTTTGIEGSLVYAASALLRDRIQSDRQTMLCLDLLPDHEASRVEAELRRPRGSRSLSTHLKSRLGIDGVKAALLHELLPRELMLDPAALAAALKALPLTLTATRPIAEAISSAGGVVFEALDEDQMLRVMPGVHVAGEMLDWEAPTGGYLLTACFASGRAAGEGVLRRLARSN